MAGARTREVSSWLADARETRGVLEGFGLIAKHRLGQNFLVDDTVVGRILGLAELSDADAVLEVGPGIGTLTVALLPRAGAVVAVEADRDLLPVLAETCAQDSERLAVIQGDALRVGPGELMRALASLDLEGVPTSPTKLVSNLPYQVAATLVLRTLSQLPSVRREVVMVQAEVADRMCAGPGSRTYGAYTAKLALRGEVTGRFDVAPSSFVPAPHVDSSVVRIDRRTPDTAAGLPWADQVIDAAFAQRRKTVRNSMAATGFDKASLDRAFERCGIDGRARAETLPPHELLRLAESLREMGSPVVPAGTRGGRHG